MGVKDPLTGVRAHTEQSQFMFQVSIYPSLRTIVIEARY